MSSNTSLLNGAELHTEIQNPSDDDAVPDADLIREWAAQAYLKVGDVPADLSIRIVDEQEGRQLNQQYRNKSTATNVLSFPQQAMPELERRLLGDIVICAPVVRREAQQSEKQPDAHWAHMVVHGVLHLCGYDHQQGVEAQEMEALESEIMLTLNYDDPYLGNRT